MPRRKRDNAIRGGMTLIELLMVVFILLLVTAIAIPVMRPAMEGRRIREAARAMNVYLGSARGRAAEIGRPCGVLIERYDGNPQLAMTLHQAEVPPPYAGDLDNAVIKLTGGPPNWNVEIWPLGAAVAGGRSYTRATCSNLTPRGTTTRLAFPMQPTS